MATGRPLWPGRSDIDQLYRIIQTLGGLTQRHQDIFSSNSYFTGLQVPTTDSDRVVGLKGSLAKYGPFNPEYFKFLAASLQQEPTARLDCKQLLEHSFFAVNGFKYALLLCPAMPRMGDGVGPPLLPHGVACNGVLPHGTLRVPEVQLAHPNLHQIIPTQQRLVSGRARQNARAPGHP